MIAMAQCSRAASLYASFPVWLSWWCCEGFPETACWSWVSSWWRPCSSANTPLVAICWKMRSSSIVGFDSSCCKHWARHSVTSSLAQLLMAGLTKNICITGSSIQQKHHSALHEWVKSTPLGYVTSVAVMHAISYRNECKAHHWVRYVMYCSAVILLGYCMRNYV